MMGLYIAIPRTAEEAEAALEKFPTVAEAAPIDAVLLSGATDWPGALCEGWKDALAARDIAMMVEDDVDWARALGADGLHLTRANPKAIKSARLRLSDKMQLGADCGRSTDRAMEAAEAGADYVMFGPVAQEEGSKMRPVSLSRVKDWAMFAEVPAVLSGIDTAQTAEHAAATGADFLFINSIWREDDPAAALRELCAPLPAE